MIMKKVITNKGINYYDKNCYGDYRNLRFEFLNNGMWCYYQYDKNDNMIKMIDNVTQWRKRNNIPEPNWIFKDRKLIYLDK